MIPDISDTAWALLGVLHRAERGGPSAPFGFDDEYAELRANGLAARAPDGIMRITRAGEAALADRYAP